MCSAQAGRVTSPEGSTGAAAPPEASAEHVGNHGCRSTARGERQTAGQSQVPTHWCPRLCCAGVLDAVRTH
eukprot:5505820-Alexandrium_andersonii.AAC.1